MASLLLAKSLLFLGFVLIVCNASVQAQVDETSIQPIIDSLDRPPMISLYDGEFGAEDDDGDIDGVAERRWLFWRTIRYYISYGALRANRIPCPPRSGRSYYTHNCFKARGPANPYARGCSAITRCRR